MGLTESVSYGSKPSWRHCDVIVTLIDHFLNEKYSWARKSFVFLDFDRFFLVWICVRGYVSGFKINSFIPGEMFLMFLSSKRC